MTKRPFNTNIHDTHILGKTISNVPSPVNPGPIQNDEEKRGVNRDMIKQMKTTQKLHLKLKLLFKATALSSLRDTYSINTAGKTKEEQNKMFLILIKKSNKLDAHIDANWELILKKLPLSFFHEAEKQMNNVLKEELKKYLTNRNIENSTTIEPISPKIGDNVRGPYSNVPKLYSINDLIKVFKEIRPSPVTMVNIEHNYSDNPIVEANETNREPKNDNNLIKVIGQPIQSTAHVDPKNVKASQSDTNAGNFVNYVLDQLNAYYAEISIIPPEFNPTFLDPLYKSVFKTLCANILHSNTRAISNNTHRNFLTLKNQRTAVYNYVDKNNILQHCSIWFHYDVETMMKHNTIQEIQHKIKNNEFAFMLKKSFKDFKNNVNDQCRVFSNPFYYIRKKRAGTPNSTAKENNAYNGHTVDIGANNEKEVRKKSNRQENNVDNSSTKIEKRKETPLTNSLTHNKNYPTYNKKMTNPSIKHNVKKENKPENKSSDTILKTDPSIEKEQDEANDPLKEIYFGLERRILTKLYEKKIVGKTCKEIDNLDLEFEKDWVVFKLGLDNKTWLEIKETLGQDFYIEAVKWSFSELGTNNHKVNYYYTAEYAYLLNSPNVCNRFPNPKDRFNYVVNQMVLFMNHWNRSDLNCNLSQELSSKNSEEFFSALNIYTSDDDFENDKNYSFIYDKDGILNRRWQIRVNYFVQRPNEFKYLKYTQEMDNEVPGEEKENSEKEWLKNWFKEREENEREEKERLEKYKKERSEKYKKEGLEERLENREKKQKEDKEKEKEKEREEDKEKEREEDYNNEMEEWFENFEKKQK